MPPGLSSSTAAGLCGLCLTLAWATGSLAVDSKPTGAGDTETAVTHGAITIDGHSISYTAEAGLLVVNEKDPPDDDAPPRRDERTGTPPLPPEASMSYVAYFKGDREDSRRPITFVFNGGPGSSTVWLHIGALGPLRVATADGRHTPAAPYRVIDNQYSLIDASDLVFVDAPGTGFGHLRGADKEKAFLGVDPDAHAFANFIVGFLSRHQRWNSPKYLFGESYGTARAAVLAYVLQSEKSVDVNGVILLSQILNFADNIDSPQFNPGIDLPYVTALPTFAATAWYHHKLSNPPELIAPFLREVEHFAMTDYAQALAEGATLPPSRKAAIAARLHDYTSLPVDLILRANLRVNGGEFEKNLLGGDLITGRFDTRFVGRASDPLSKETEYDPQWEAISSAYVSAFNDYIRSTLKFGGQKPYRVVAEVGKIWDFSHQPPGSTERLALANVMPDLAVALQRNPDLRIMLNAGYYDLATPYFAAAYELRHLAIQPELQNNIEMHFYDSGHMVYAREPDLQALHANVAAFIAKTH